MTKILLLLSVLLLPYLVSAQDDEIDNLPFDNEPLRDDARSYFVLAGGVTFDWLMIKEDNLNSFFKDTPEELKLSGPLRLTGGQGVTGIPWIKNLRIGVFGYGGNIKSSTLVESYPGINSNGDSIQSTTNSQSSLIASMFGFSLHYGYVPFEHFAILGGVNAGWGDVTYEQSIALTSPKDAQFTFPFGVSRFEKNYFFIMPNIQLEYALANFIILRADASYNLTVGQDTDWTYNNLGKNSVNPDFNLSGLKLGFGVMVGLVNF